MNNVTEMLIIKYKHKKIILNTRKFKTLFAALAAACIFGFICVEFFRFPEIYSTTMRRALKADIQSGDAAAVEYYEQNYTANGRELFPEM